MATALARGCVQSGLVSGSQILAADPSAEARQTFLQQVPDAKLVDGNEHLLAAADVVLLAVKPQVMPAVLAEIAGAVSERHLLISIAAGIPLQKMARALPPQTRLVRVMPNTPCLVGLGASCFSLGTAAHRDDGRLVQQVLESVGLAFPVEEHLLDAVTGLAGSGPAFVYSVIEALTVEGTAQGLPAELAALLATQTVRGAAEMVLATQQSPAELRAQVTSPGGTTVAGLAAWEHQQGATAVRAAVAAATQRSAELGGDHQNGAQ